MTDKPVHLAYHDANREAGRYPGNVRIRVRYQHLATAWFELLWLSPDELADFARASTWELTDIFRTGVIYAAELLPR